MTAVGSSNALLASLAIIKANWDDSQDTYIDSFLPFFLEACKSADTDTISMTESKQFIQEAFGIKMPDGVLATLSKRAAQKGYGRREAGSFIADAEKMKQLPDMARQRADYLRKQASLVDELIKFSVDRFALVLTVDEAEDSLLAHVEEYSTSLLSAVVKGKSYPDGADSLGQRDLEYIVNSFISHVVSSVPLAFEHLEAVVKGSMLAASLYLPDVGEVTRRFNKTTLYFDTPLIIRALGYEGAEAKGAVEDLLGLCHASGASIACFEHNVQEVRGILDRSARNASGTASQFSSARRATAAHFTRNGITSSDILLLREGLEENIARLQIDVQEKPLPSAELTIDETELEHRMEDEMGYQNRDALLKDLDSLTAVHRLRGGRSGARLETCGAIFVTTNGGLARLSQSFFVRNGTHQWSVAITDHHLATLVWLKKPHTAPDLPRRQILADCYAALEPGKRLWDLYLGEIDRLRAAGRASEEDIMLLRSSTEAQRGLMDMTLGNPEHMSQQVVVDILNTIKSDLVGPTEEQRDEAVASMTVLQVELGSTKKALGEMNTVLGQERHEKVLLKQQSTDLQTRLEALEGADQNRRDLAKNRAERSANRLHAGILVLLGLVLLVSLTPLFVAADSSIIPAWFRALSPISAIITTVLSVIVLFFGGSVRANARWAKKCLAGWLESWHLRRAGLE